MYQSTYSIPVKMSEPCTICQEQIGTNRWVLPCHHAFHPICIRTAFDANHNKRDEETLERLYAQCANCRYKLHKRDVPSRRRVIRMERMQPAYAALPADQRPKRLSKETTILKRENMQEALATYVARRERIKAANRSADQQSQPDPSFAGNSGALKLSASNEPQPGPSGICNRGDSSTESSQKSVPGLVWTSSSSSLEDEPISTQAVSSQRARSRSPLSQGIIREPPPHVGAESAPVLQSSSELQEVQMQISILEDQLRQVSQMPPRTCLIEEVLISDNESANSESDDDELGRSRPLRIIGHLNLGRHTKYRVLWSDGCETINPTKEIELKDPQMLLEYRRRKGTENVRRHRAKIRAEKIANREKRGG